MEKGKALDFRTPVRHGELTLGDDAPKPSPCDTCPQGRAKHEVGGIRLCSRCYGWIQLAREILDPQAQHRRVKPDKLKGRHSRGPL